MSVVSIDHGKTWAGPFTVEPGQHTPGGLPNAYGNIVLAPDLNSGRGRLFTVYNLNYLNMSMPGRNDELGKFFLRYSDDGGRSWSPERFEVPYPNTWVDNRNQWSGRHRLMWTVDQIKTRGGEVYFAFTKIGAYLQNPMSIYSNNDHQPRFYSRGAE